jgi:hypothetical protein
VQLVIKAHRVVEAHKDIQVLQVLKVLKVKQVQLVIKV